MLRKKILVKHGDKYNLWTVWNEVPRKEGTRRFWCQCVCGEVRLVGLNSLRSGKSKSCGCMKKGEYGGDGWSTTRLYRAWHAMRQRCNNPTDANYKYYGARGIRVCDEWDRSAGAFKEWAERHGYKEGLQIDRIDNEKGYSPENCRWVTSITNARNRRGSRWWHVFGVRYGSVREAAESVGLYPEKIRKMCHQNIDGCYTELKYK